MGSGIHMRSDISYLFSGMNNNANASNSLTSLLSDYSSIKNGSYGKLMKAYYAEDTNASVKKLAGNTKADDISKESKAYAKVQNSSDSLKDATDKLLDKKMDYSDKEAVYSAVSDFVKSYNSVIEAADKVSDSTTINRVENMMNRTVGNMKMLAAAGITVNSDATLSVADKDTFMGQNMDKVKAVFSGNGSYGYQTSAQASLINYAANNAADKGSAYNVNGNYATGFSSGNIFSSYF